MGKLLLCVVPRLSLERTLLRERPTSPCRGACHQNRCHHLCNTPSILHSQYCAGRGGRFPIHVMIATLPIAAALGELGGVCHHLNQSHHSRVSPLPSLCSGGTLVECLEIAKISLKWPRLT